MYFAAVTSPTQFIMKGIFFFFFHFETHLIETKMDTKPERKINQCLVDVRLDPRHSHQLLFFRLLFGIFLLFF